MIPLGVIAGWISLAIFVSGYTLSIVSLVLAATVLLIFLLRRKDPGRRTSRIRIHPRERVVLVAGGPRKPKKCPACRLALEEGGTRARCELNQGHEIHEDCRQFMQGKCPVCNGKLI